MREADDKRHLCYALNEVALTCLDCQCSDRASAYARDALEAADILDSPTERIVARAILIEAALMAAEMQHAERLLPSMRDLLADAPIAPRSQAALQRLRDRYPAITTMLQTQAY